MPTLRFPGRAAGTLRSMDTNAPAEHTGWVGGGPARPAVATTDRAPGPVEDQGGSPSTESTVDRVDRLLDDVERALARLDDGTYGRCAVCGDAIDDARLAVEPTVERCGSCSVAATSPDFPVGETGGNSHGLVTGESA